MKAIEGFETQKESAIVFSYVSGKSTAGRNHLDGAREHQQTSSNRLRVQLLAR